MGGKGIRRGRKMKEKWKRRRGVSKEKRIGQKNEWEGKELTRERVREKIER